MIKEFKNESQAKAIADSLGLFITKYKGVYLVSNSKEELLANYNLGYFQKEGVFYDKEVFKENWGFIVIRNRGVVDASSVELPYGFTDCACMLRNCTSLKVPPKIPEGVLSCREMFSGCTSLRTPPIIPKSVKNCVRMFSGCTSLKSPPIIPEGVQYCTSMFRQCTSLEEPPEIPGGVYDCSFMFQGCISLKSLPNFPENCYTIGALDDTPFERVQL